MDHLDTFRRHMAGAKVLPGPDRIPYAAYRSGDNPLVRLKIHPKDRAWERLSYSYLQRMIEDGIYGTLVVLIYSAAVVVIKGRNLQHLADAIDAETCEFIQEFDPARWAMPVDEKEPFIEELSVHVETREQIVRTSDWALADIEAKHKAGGV
jgi:hypothetical protein